MLSPEEKRVIQSVDQADVERLAVEAARIPSYSLSPGSEEQLALFFARGLHALGADVHLQEVERHRPNVIGYLRGNQEGNTVLFNGHLDTGPPVLGWTRDPYGGEMEGNKLFGHGVSNMKGSDVAMVGAMAALHTANVRIAGDIIISLVMGECSGGQGTKYMLAQGVRADYFINGEPTDLQVLTLHAGVCRLKIAVAGRSHHFGMAGKGVNAIEKLMKVLGTLGESLTPIGPDGWLRKRQDKPEYEGFPRFNLGVIRGGLTRDCLDWGPYNTPDYCFATLDVRYPPGLSPDLIRHDLEGLIQRLSATDGDLHASVELMLDFHMPPFEASPNDYIVSAILSSCADVLGTPPRVGALAPMKFMGADAGSLQAAGIRGVMCGVGTFTSSVPEEHIDMSQLVDLTRIYALTAYRVANKPK